MLHRTHILPNYIKRATITLSWHRHIYTIAQFKIFVIADLNDSTSEVIVFVDEVDFLIEAFFGADAVVLGLR